MAYNVAANGNATRAGEAVAKDRRAESYHHPITIVRAALDPAAMLSNPRTQDNQSVVDITTADGLMFTLAIDSMTKLPTRVVSMTDNTNLGDVAIETSFADYQDVNGLKLPARLTTKTDKYHDRGAAGNETSGRRRYRRSGGACRRRIGRGTRRSSADGYRRGSRAWHLVARRREPSQRPRRVRGPHDAD